MPSLCKLPVTLRVLFSSFLILIGVGYLMAISYLFLVDVQPHQQMGMGLVSGIEMKYHGAVGGSRLEAALQGIMADKLSPSDRDRILRWVRGGAPEAEMPMNRMPMSTAHDGAPEGGYAAVKPIFDNNCVPCHNPSSGLQIPPLASFQDIQKLTQSDTGQSVMQLARVSHIHLFGIGMIFLLTGIVFSLSETPIWLRISLVVLPYLAILADIGSWWLTKFIPVFGIVVIVGGALMGVALAGQILISLWEMWLPIPWSRAAAGGGKL